MEEFKELVLIAIDALLGNKLRTFLTALGIIIGTASVIAMTAIGNGAKVSIESRITSLGANLITVSAGSTASRLVASGSGSAQTLTYDDYTAIKSALGTDMVSGISPEQSRNSQLIYKDQNTNTSITGASPDYMTVHNYTLQSGSFFSDLQNQTAAHVIVLGNTTATTLFPNTDPIGQQIQIGQDLYTVIGVFNSKGTSGFANQDDLGVIPINTSMRYLVGTNVLRTISIQAVDQNQMTPVQNTIFGLLVQRHNTDPTNPDFTINNSQSTLDTLSSVTSTLTFLLAGIAGISLLVGGIGIMNTMIISITERTHEIGLRKAIGAKDRLILLQFVIESVVLSVVGALLGIVFGAFLSLVLSATGLITTGITLSSVLGSASISILVGLIFGIYPARRAAKMNAIEALRYE